MIKMDLEHTSFKGRLSGLRQFLAIEIPLKNYDKRSFFPVKNYFRSEDIFKFLTRLLGYVGKRDDKKAMVNSQIYDVTYRATNNTIHILPKK